MKKILSTILLLAALSACNQEGTENPGSAVKAPVLTCHTTASAALAPGLDNTAVTLSWENGTDGVINTIEMSVDSLFKNPYSNLVAQGVTAFSYTFRELNDILIDILGMKEGVAAPVYIRLSASLDEETVYSNFATITVTPGSILASPVLNCSTSEVTLLQSKPSRLAFSLSWTKNGKGVNSAIQISSESEFLLPYSMELGSDVHDYQFTYGTLNKILSDELGLEAETTAEVYFRVLTYFETSASFSNTAVVRITPNAQNDEGNVLYVGGFSAADPWNFEDYLVCYNEEYKAYSGVHEAKSQWGYRFYPEKDNWDIYYTMASGGTATSGYLSANGSGNIPAPNAGLYLFDVNISSSYYKLYEVKTVSYTGINDDWNLHAMKQQADNPTVYTAQVTVSKPNPYRWQVVFNSNWDLKLCAEGGKLLLYNEGAATEQIENGTYTLTVNLATSTYTLQK